MSKSFIRKFFKTGFIAINILAAILFLCSCYNGWFNPQYWWVIGIINLASFYLLLLLLFYLLFWLFVRPRWSLISLLALLLAIKPIKNIVPFRFPSKFTLQKDSQSLRIMSWNVAQFDIRNYKKDPSVKQAMIALINRYEPDVACFQEMVCGDSLINLNTPYYQKRSFYYLGDFLNALHFSDQFYVYNVKEDFATKQHFGLIIFSKYPIIQKKMISVYPHNYNSIFEYVDIVKNADTFRVFNIHLQSLRFSQSNLRYIDNPGIKDEGDLQKSKSVLAKLKTGLIKRKMQAETIRAEMEKSPYPNIVCGDFNDLPNSYAYTTIGKGMKNAFVEKGSGIGRTFSSISPTLRIDNIFVSPAFSVTQFVRVPQKLSDHFPIIADVKKQQ